MPKKQRDDLQREDEPAQRAKEGLTVPGRKAPTSGQVLPRRTGSANLRGFEARVRRAFPVQLGVRSTCS